MIFSDRLGLGRRMAGYLTEQGNTCILVTVGKKFGQPRDGEFTLRPAQFDDYFALCRELSESDRMPNKIVHLWSVTQANEPETNSDLFSGVQNLGFYSLIYLAKAIGMQDNLDPIEIIIVSNGVHAVTGTEILHPEKATLLGACKSIPQEYGMIACRAIDLEVSSNEVKLTEILASQLLAELAGPLSDPIVAYRGDERYAQTYESMHLERPTTDSLLRRKGVYLITGGLGGIGSVLSKHLANTVQAKLALTSRSVFPDRKGWKEWLATHGESDRTSIRIRKVQELEDLAAEVLVLQADIADYAQMKQAIATVQARFGKIHGVIHAAGVSHIEAFNAIQAIQPNHCEMHFRPKVYGLYVLQKILKEQPIDFCVLFSSLSAVLAGLGMAAYTAANIFMDAFADKCNRTAAICWTSIDWDQWQLGESEKRHGVLGGSIEKFAMRPAEGLEAFERILARGPGPRIVVSTGDLDARLRQWIYFRIPDLYK